MPEEQIVQLGVFIRALLTHPDFNEIVELYEKDVVRQMLTTKPEELHTRERSYADFRGLSEFLGFMQSIAQKAHEIENRQEPVNPEEPISEEDGSDFNF